jgi:hypothetical protein
MATRLKNKLAMAEDQVKEAYENGATLREIGEVHEVSAGTVRNKLIELGIDLRPRGRRKKEQGSDDRVLPTEALPAEPVATAVSAVADPTPAIHV